MTNQQKGTFTKEELEILDKDENRRHKQKGVECSVPGCTDWCVCNDLCHNHNMAKYRYGDALGKPEKKRRCRCGETFSHKYDSVKKCLRCRTEHRRKKNAEYVRRHREAKK